jgi:uncharacterized protein
MATAIAPIPHRDIARIEMAPPPAPHGRPFLTAEWRDLAMLSYAVDPAVLAPHVPAGTQLDSWHGETFASIVGFFFRKPRLYGVPVPLHASFEEVNLRFYVRREMPQGWRRGVVFIRELVPKRTVAWLARTAYGQNFLRVPMAHELNRPSGGPRQAPRRLAFSWRLSGREHRVAVETNGAAQLPEPGSLAEFIAEHYWAYATVRGRTHEYYVVHPPWQISPALHTEFAADVRTLYGPSFVPFLTGAPACAFWADGSPVEVYAQRRR